MKEAPGMVADKRPLSIDEKSARFKYSTMVDITRAIKRKKHNKCTKVNKRMKLLKICHVCVIAQMIISSVMTISKRSYTIIKIVTS